MPTQIPSTTIRDTIEAVFRDRAYNRLSLMDRVLAWIGEVLEALFSRVRGVGQAPEPVVWALIGLLGVIVAAVIARALWSIAASRRPGRPRGMTTSGTGASGPWQTALMLAERGDYTAAAHALYAALLEFIARNAGVELHESRTIGDYVRELSRRSSNLLGRFRNFAHTYEAVIYGTGFCDRDRYQRLLSLARELVETAS